MHKNSTNMNYFSKSVDFMHFRVYNDDVLKTTASSVPDKMKEGNTK